MDYSEELFNRILPNACKYMRADINNLDGDFMAKCQSVFLMLRESEHFNGYSRYMSVKDFFRLIGHYSEVGEDLSFYLDGCENVVIIAATLGLFVDSKSARLLVNNTSEAVIFDAFASALLEAKTDEYEDALELGPHTFRFAPGYGDIPVEINDILIDGLSLQQRIGLNKTSNHLMLPQKSIIGICGIDKTLAPLCGHCPRLSSCSLRKENLQCYSC